MQSHTLSLNKFSRPLVLNGSDAVYMHLIHLILLTKGKYQSHPDMGVGLRERYKFDNDKEFLVNLSEDIKNQVQQYLPELQFVDISLNFRNGVLGIIIDTTNGVYVMAYDTDKDTMDAAATYVLGDL